MNLKKRAMGHEKRTRAALKRRAGALALAACTALLGGCHPDMWNQPKFTAMQQSDFFPDASAARPRIPGTVTYDGMRRKWSSPVFETLTGESQVPTVMDARFWTGRDGAGFVADNYFEITPALIAHGRERFEASCVPCHGKVGDGTGIVTRRQNGFPNPPSYHIDRLREVEDGYVFDVMTNGFGRMFSVAWRVTPEDRWAIASYIRALQYSQNAKLADLTPEERNEVLAPPKAEAPKEEVAEENAH